MPDQMRLTGELVELLRTARGMKQVDLAKASGVSQAVISKVESGLVELELSRLEAVAGALGVPTSRLVEGAAAGGTLSACAFHRKRSTLPVSDAKRIRALLDLARLQIEELVPVDAASVLVPRIAPTPDGFVTASDVARDVRRVMALPDGPTTNLVEAIESLGAVVLVRDLGAAKIDAIGSWPDGHRPVFMLNTTTSGDRQRFTLAHELGHAVMHQTPTENQEAEADQFASELLMPTKAIRNELGNLSLPRLIQLKTRWGVSMASLIRKARDLGEITDSEYTRLNVELSKAGYRTKEPVVIEHEAPGFVANCVRAALADGTSVDVLAESAHMLPEEFVNLYAAEIR